MDAVRYMVQKFHDTNEDGSNDDDKRIVRTMHATTHGDAEPYHVGWMFRFGNGRYLKDREQSYDLSLSVCAPLLLSVSVVVVASPLL